MNSQEQVKEESIEEYNVKERINKQKRDSFLLYTAIFFNVMIILFFPYSRC